jgi:hypothetical protein
MIENWEDEPLGSFKSEENNNSIFFHPASAGGERGVVTLGGYIDKFKKIIIMDQDI